MTDVILALDIGGTKALGGLITPSHEIVHTAEFATGGTPGSIDPGLTTVSALAAALLETAADRGLSPIAVGAGFPEYVSDGLFRSRDVLAWDRQPADLLSELLVPGLAVTIESDVRCGALAEARLGAGRGFERVAYLSWGTGLSWTLVEGGAAVAGRRGEAIGFGELGVSARVDPQWKGNLEQFASGKGIAMRYSALTGTPVDETREVLALAAGGDQGAALIIDTAAGALGEALSWMTALLDPDLIVLGGGLGVSDTLLRARAEEVYQNAPSTRPDAAPIVSSRLGTHSGLLGAALATGRLAS